MLENHVDYTVRSFPLFQTSMSTEQCSTHFLSLHIKDYSRGHQEVTSKVDVVEEEKEKTNITLF